MKAVQFSPTKKLQREFWYQVEGCIEGKPQTIRRTTLQNTRSAKFLFRGWWHAVVSWSTEARDGRNDPWNAFMLAAYFPHSDVRQRNCVLSFFASFVFRTLVRNSRSGTIYKRALSITFELSEPFHCQSRGHSSEVGGSNKDKFSHLHHEQQSRAGVLKLWVTTQNGSQNAILGLRNKFAWQIRKKFLQTLQENSK